MKTVTILGASGSIGTSALKFLRLHPESFDLRAIAFGSNVEAARSICVEFGVKHVAFHDEAAANAFGNPAGVTVYAGPKGVCELASLKVDTVLGAVSGSIGLPAVLCAIDAGNQVALANKESLVCGGQALLDRARAKNVPIIPVDSEHSAIFQCLLAGKPEEVHSILLTASGGPFRSWSAEKLKSATPEQALAHPNWDMGPKNSLDSATLANKGLELIETCYFFDVAPQDITIVVHPGSILHSAVQYCDGSVIAQLGETDMCGAIGYGLSFPDRIPTGLKPLDLITLGQLKFEAYDARRFPAAELARHSLSMGQPGTLMFNAANEVAGKAFLDGQIGFTDIAKHIDKCLEKGGTKFAANLNDIVNADMDAKAWAQSLL